MGGGASGSGAEGGVKTAGAGVKSRAKVDTCVCMYNCIEISIDTRMASGRSESMPDCVAETGHIR